MERYEKALLCMLKAAINGRKDYPEEEKLGTILTDEEWYNLMDMAENHSVSAFLYEVYEQFDMPDFVVAYCKNQARKVAYQNYKLLYISSHVLRKLKENNINAVLLKGWQTASLYPVPELRKSGDVDILVTKKEQFDKAVNIIKSLGFKQEENQHANHHIELRTNDGISVEVHTDLSEKFADEEMNLNISAVTSQIDKKIVETKILEYPVMVADEAYDAFSLLIHMLHHFMRAGFGIKLLCDWVVFWNRNLDDTVKEEFYEIIKKCNLAGFAGAINCLCINFLGLDEKKVSFMGNKAIPSDICDNLMEDIIEAQEFGKSRDERMVIMTQSGVRGYISEFHHQMKINNPKFSKCVLCWPYLWVKTLIVFIINNKKNRKISIISVLKNANKRSKMIKDINIFNK